MACLVLIGAAAGLPEKEKDKKLEPGFIEGVNAAIEKGVAWLLKRQTATGKFPGFKDSRGEIYPLGMHALSTLAVIKANHPVDSREVTQAMKILRGARTPAGGATRSTPASPCSS